MNEKINRNESMAAISFGAFFGFFVGGLLLLIKDGFSLEVLFLIILGGGFTLIGIIIFIVFKRTTKKSK